MADLPLITKKIQKPIEYTYTQTVRLRLPYNIKKDAIFIDYKEIQSDSKHDTHGDIIESEKISGVRSITRTHVNGFKTPNLENILYSKAKVVKLSLGEYTFVAISNTLKRLNSNIYKNIFAEDIFDMDFINQKISNAISSTEDIKQDNHGLSVNDFVYLDVTDNKYKKALAEDSARANVRGIVSKVAGPNVFTLMDSGKVPFSHLDYNDTTVLYLSDKVPGEIVHYSEISNTVYIPVATYIENNIIINLQQGSIGDKLAPYEKEEQLFELYTQPELNAVISQLVNGVKQ